MIVNSEALRLPLPDASVHAALCSPPYWGGLRTYTGDQDREWPAISYPPMPGLPFLDIPAQSVALGHETDPYAFVAHLLQVFREVRRVLRPGACLSVNLGDSYSGSRCGPQGQNGQRSRRWFTRERSETSAPAGLPSKNLLLMPWRFALAMQADGWILRSRMPGGVEVADGERGIEPDILWKKTSTMPESVRDRPTNDFEDVLLFSQSARYFWDQEAGREAHAPNQSGGAQRARETGSLKYAADDFKFHQTGAGHSGLMNRPNNPAGRNMRSVWTINPEPTDEEHFAAWPVALAARLIKVMTSEKGVCPECGAPWMREVERIVFDRSNDRKYVEEQRNPAGMVPGSNTRGMPDARPLTKSWQALCEHDTEPVPATVLDPFAGLGRTWEAARETGRRFIGTDLGLAYCHLALSRNDVEAMERRRRKRAPEDWGPLFAET